MRILSIFGARPQFVKAALVSRRLRQDGEIDEVLVNTGQHYDEMMSDIFLRELEMPAPDYNLEAGSGSHAAQTARILERTEKVLITEKPDCAIVYGDTNSTLGGALAAAKLHIPVVHVEAGLRSFNRRMPEELNRVVTDHLADLLLAPSERAKGRLLDEGIPESRIEVVGDVMYDAALHFLEISEASSTILQRLALTPKEYALCTIHRAENTEDLTRLDRILSAFDTVSLEMPVVLPVHPRLRDTIDSARFERNFSPNFKMIGPVGYLDMIALERNAAVVATDSGGVQKEAFFYQVPCVTLRGETEWMELIELGWNRLVPPDGTSDVAAALRSSIGAAGQTDARPYGDGDAAGKIVNAVRKLCSKNPFTREEVVQ
ncbi:MAG TPA: UDP-N-acetylglucosamine 2-epimerase (non-hydrolyzing) [Terracidiphilus sp.]|nr:UDP-N-acetylglucosamine 2-epimerase (non-hydrolyzing) [Terracidiphilus sp.]